MHKILNMRNTFWRGPSRLYKNSLRLESRLLIRQYAPSSVYHRRPLFVTLELKS